LVHTVYTVYMLYDEWLSSLPMSSFRSDDEISVIEEDPYEGALEIQGKYVAKEFLIIMRGGTSHWEMMKKSGRKAMVSVCSSPFRDHIVRCAESMYGMPEDGWQITKREGDARKKRSDTARGGRPGNKKNAGGGSGYLGED
jgi:hypothetical protein